MTTLPLIQDCVLIAVGTIGFDITGEVVLAGNLTDAATAINVNADAIAYVLSDEGNTYSGTGTIEPLESDRAAWDALNYPNRHANDIDDSPAAIHHTIGPSSNQAAAGDHTHATPGVVTSAIAEYASTNVSNPPSENDIISAFGDVATVDPGFLGILNDNADESHVYLCGATVAGWWYVNLAKSAALVATALSILAGDSFTDANGTHLNVHTMNIGAGWTENTGSWTISSNAAVQATAGGIDYLVTTETGDANVKIHARIKTSAASGFHSAGIIARFTDTSNFWVIDYGIGGTSVFRITDCVAGVFTVRASKTFTARYQTYIDIDVTLSGNIITATFDGGYTLTYTSSFNNTATKHGLREYRDGTYGANIFEDFQVIDLPTYAWTRTGTVLSASVAWEDSNVYEPSIIYEANPQILTADRVMKLWYGGGWSTPGIGYAESDDLGATWTKYASNPVISGLTHAVVVKFDSTYYAYGANTAGNKIVLWTSSDGISWTLYGDVLSLGAGGQWDDTLLGNAFVWRESLTAYYMLYDARTGSGAWKEGLATSTDGLTWSKSGSNPVLAMDGGTIGSSYLRKIGSTYYLWLLRSAPTTLPTYLVRYKSTNLTAWTAWPDAPIITRSGAGEGEDTYIGQAADPDIVDDGTTAYLFFAASADGTQASGAFHIVRATADARAIGGY